MKTSRPKNDSRSLLIAAAAAFCVYFCMYAFRKPFTAAEFDGKAVFGSDLKSTLIISQLIGYMLSKFIGIRIVSELNRKYRTLAILGLIAFSELALLCFAVLPTEYKVFAMFLNGLPLGMVFGFVLSYLEGRTTTEALSAVLCASFIMASGVVKSVGQWLIQVQGVNEFNMPMITGLIFLAPLLLSVFILHKTPPPSTNDIQARKVRVAMSSGDRWTFFRAYWPGLTALFAVYVILTIVRSFRDDFGVEIWQGLGVSGKPAIYTHSETIVMIFVTLLNAIAIYFRNNIKALVVTFSIMATSFLLLIGVTIAQEQNLIGPLSFMVLCGVGLYMPYVAFHTTVFERIVSASSLSGNLVFLMYLADSIGYLGYVLLLAAKSHLEASNDKLAIFQNALYSLSVLSIIFLGIAAVYFYHTLSKERSNVELDV